MERRLTLLEGEAWFEASPNPARPFVVAAASGTVTALGTAFDIALESETARVTVTEHRVAIASQGRSLSLIHISTSEGPASGEAPVGATRVSSACAQAQAKKRTNTIEKCCFIRHCPNGS